MTQETNDVVTQELIERLGRLIERQRDQRGDYLDRGAADPELIDAKAALQSQSAGIAELREALEDAVGLIHERCLSSAKGCGLNRFQMKRYNKALSLTKDSTSG